MQVICKYFAILNKGCEPWQIFVSLWIQNGYQATPVKTTIEVDTQSFILEFKSSAHWDLRIFIKQKENVHFPSPTSLLGNPCLIYPSLDALMACPQTSDLSLMGSQLSVPVFGLQLEYCLQQCPRENFFLFCVVIAFPFGLQLSCAKH